jgi:hypothetical protein
MAVLGRKTPRRAVRFCRSFFGIWLSAAAPMQLLPIVPIWSEWQDTRIKASVG